MLELRVAKGRNWSIKEDCSPGAKFKEAGRFLLRQHGNFLNVAEMVSAGVALHGEEYPTLVAREMYSLRNIAPTTIDKYMVVWGELMEQVPFMPALLPDLSGSSYGVVLLGHFLDAHARSARSDDVGALRYDAMSYIEEVKLPNGMHIRYRAGRDKTSRGFKDLATARLLTPRRMRHEFDADPELFCRRVREGTTKFGALDYPSYMYPEEAYDEDRMDAGLCRGTFLVRCFRHIFTGKRTAWTSPQYGSKGGRKPVAELNKMDSVTPENIAYVAVLTRFILNTQDTWQADDNKFIGEEYFNAILHLFVDEEWRMSTLKWWNEEVFGTTGKMKTTARSK
ncbi:hypothetical protein A0H81_09348 [Grifola frondosa]|uniref:Uncharacterized protein n=1 Tax=Grifola frondosa TaxID=5627 RepID=A0A1C7M1Z1_GRIFR|nr:hypothetical protein A0H81_09348 [Grifola frondosa]